VEFVNQVEEGLWALIAYSLGNIQWLLKDVDLVDGEVPKDFRDILEKFTLPVTRVGST